MMFNLISAEVKEKSMAPNYLIDTLVSDKIKKRVLKKYCFPLESREDF